MRAFFDTREDLRALNKNVDSQERQRALESSDNTGLLGIGYFSKNTEACNWDTAGARCSMRFPVSMPQVDPGAQDGATPSAENGEGGAAPDEPPRGDEVGKNDMENEGGDNVKDKLDADDEKDKKDKENGKKHKTPAEEWSGHKKPRTLRPQASVPASHFVELAAGRRDGHVGHRRGAKVGVHRHRQGRWASGAFRSAA